MELDKKQLESLQAQIYAAYEKIGISKKVQQLAEIEKQVSQADLWQNPTHAQDLLREQSTLKKNVDLWEGLTHDIKELIDLFELDDPTLRADLQKQFIELKSKFEQAAQQLKFSGPFDDHGVVLSIYAGAGGTDAQDWAQMLRRMYLRYAEQNKLKAQIIDESVGDEAGIKSSTLLITGDDNVYGKLKGEHGVHRLVRLSPFNADNLRQTSFAKVEVVPKIDAPEEVKIDDKDLKIDVYRSGGHGGQSVNTTDSAVRVTHLPTGITVAIQNERSQLQNRETAMTILRSKLAALQQEQHQENISELKGPNEQAAWGNQIRSYVLHPYKMVKDLRTNHETSDVEAVLDGDLESFINAYLESL